MDIQTIIKVNLDRYQKVQDELEARSIPDELLEGLVDDICSTRSFEQSRIDPYWPKWSAAWWKIVLLEELGSIELLPRETLLEYASIIDGHYIHSFPLTEDELPKGIDPYRQIICFCALGTFYRILEKCGISVKARFPWMHDWLFRYQLPDGGYNCDEAVYTQTRPRSSIVSTLPMLEALMTAQHDLSRRESDVLNSGAEYYLRHRLFRSTKGKVIDKTWILPIFPRFYQYDILRGLRFTTSWAIRTGNTLHADDIQEVLVELNNQIGENGFLPVSRDEISTAETLEFDGRNWSWADRVQIFEQLDCLLDSDLPSYYLTRDWYTVIQQLKDLFIRTETS